MTNQRVLKKRPKKEKIEKTPQNICPDCKSTDIVYDHSTREITCNHCGCVIDENNIDYGPGWVAYDQEQQISRAHAGAPASNTYHDYGIATEIDNVTNASPDEYAKWYRMKKLHTRSRILNSRQRNLALALSRIKIKCSNLALHRVIREDASLIYRKALDKNLIRGRTIEGISAAAIYIACRRNNIPRTLAEIADVTDSTRKEIARNERFLKRQLDIKLAPTSPADYIPRFATKLELSDELQAKAIQIINESRDKGLISGKGPGGIAAAAIYIASIVLNEKKSQRDIAEVAGITEVTLRNHYKMLCENLDLNVI